MVRVHRIGSTDWPSAVSDGLTLPCCDCGRVPTIDYRVTEEEWARVVEPVNKRGVLCLDCFVVRGGDVRHIEELQIVGAGVTVVTTPAVAYEWGRNEALQPSQVEAPPDGAVTG